MNNNMQNMNQGAMQYPNQQFNTNLNQPKKPKRKILTIIIVCIVGLIVLALVLVLSVSATSNKLVCKYSEGGITIMYDDDGIVGFLTENMTYDLEGQQEYAKQVGIDNYLDEFSEWFETNTDGSCSIEEK